MKRESQMNDTKNFTSPGRLRHHEPFTQPLIVSEHALASHARLHRPIEWISPTPSLVASA